MARASESFRGAGAVGVALLCFALFLFLFLSSPGLAHCERDCARVRGEVWAEVGAAFGLSVASTVLTGIGMFRGGRLFPALAGISGLATAGPGIALLLIPSGLERVGPLSLFLIFSIPGGGLIAAGAIHHLYERRTIGSMSPPDEPKR